MHHLYLCHIQIRYISRAYLDFGPGFYVTTIERQAMDYGQRFIRRGREAWLNIYEISEEFDGLNILTFKAYDETWLDFVSECRAGRIEGNYLKTSKL
jgi:hypothetical protein